MDRGYVKLWRKSIESNFYQNHKVWKFWSYCLMKASYKEHDTIIGIQNIHLMPGQFIFGRKKASKETGLTEQEIRTVILYLVNIKNITIK